MVATYAQPDVPTTIKTTVPRSIQSEFPFRVSSYQFKDLDAARKFSAELAAIPNSGHRHKVGMFHRRIEMSIQEYGKSLVLAPILLDVTTDSPDEAEAKHV